MTFDILTIGAAVRDVFLLSEAFTTVRSSAFPDGLGECVALGSKVGVERCVLATGGGATNTAVTFARLGFHTGIVARVGDDEPGRAIQRELSGEKIATTLLRTVKREQTAYSTLLMSETGERTALVFRGASGAFHPIDIPAAAFKTRWIYLTSLGAHLEVTGSILARAARAKIRVAFNPGADECARAKQTRSLVRDAAILLLNAGEARMLLESDERDAATLARAGAKLAPLCVVTDGAKGAAASDGATTWLARTTGVTATSTTGAGDAFGSGFVAGIMKAWSVEDALRLGVINAERVIRHIGAKEGIVTGWPLRRTLLTVPVRTVRSL